jgi:hypothetical protein
MRTRIIINTRPAGLMDLWRRGMELNLDLPTIDTQWRIVHIRSQIRKWGMNEADTVAGSDPLGTWHHGLLAR